MPTNICTLTTFLAAAGACTGIAIAPVAAAAPQCTTTAPNTTQCETNGSTMIVTSPQQNTWYGSWPWWGGGIVIGLSDRGR